MTIYKEIEEALQLIPFFDGNPNDLDDFLNGLRDAEEALPVLLDHFPEIVKLRLKGEAWEATRDLYFDNLDELRLHLGASFG